MKSIYDVGYHAIEFCDTDKKKASEQLVEYLDRLPTHSLLNVSYSYDAINHTAHILLVYFANSRG